MLAWAIFDRLVHDITVVSICGESYRLGDVTKQRLAGGALGQTAEATVKGGGTDTHGPESYRIACVAGGHFPLLLPGQNRAAAYRRSREQRINQRNETSFSPLG